MIEVLQKSKVKRRFHVLIGFVLSHYRRKIYGKLFVAYGVLQQILVNGL